MVFVEFPSFCIAGRNGCNLAIGILRIKFPDHMNGMRHGAVCRRKIRQQLGKIQFDIGNKSRTRLSDDRSFGIFFQIFIIRFCCQFRSETDVENGNDTGLPQPAVEFALHAFKDSCRRRRHNGDNLFPGFQVMHKSGKIVYTDSCVMLTGRQAQSAPDTQITVDFNVITRPVVTKFNGTYRDTPVTINTTFLFNGYNCFLLTHRFTIVYFSINIISQYKKFSEKNLPHTIILN